jgi:pimeloyl-ACP methyl ester carboxylesterase
MGGTLTERRSRRVRLLWATALGAGSVLALQLGCIAFGPPSLERAFAGRAQPLEHTYEGAGGVPLAAGETGNPRGPMVLFVHGTPGGWRDFAQVMADAGLIGRARLVSVDRAGWGGSRQSGLVASLGRQAEALRAVLDASPENLPAVLVGHSLGGAVAARLAMDAPDLVGALVLVAASIDPELERTTWYQAFGRTWLVRPLLPAVLARADDEIRPLRAELEAMRPEWATLRMPVFVLHGEEDALVPVANADFAARMVTGAPLAIERIPRQGHLIPWQRPERIVATVQRALDELR